MPYRPNIIPQCTPGFLSSITNRLSFLTLAVGVAACNSKSTSAGGNLAEVGCKIVPLCDSGEVDVCSVGGLVCWPSPASSVVKLRRELVGNFVSKCNLDFSPFLYLTAGEPSSLESNRLPSRDPFSWVMAKRKWGVCLFMLLRGLWWCCISLFGGFRTVLSLPRAKACPHRPPLAEEEKEKALESDAGPRRWNLWLLKLLYLGWREGRFRDCQEEKHWGCWSSVVVTVLQ